MAFDDTLLDLMPSTMHVDAVSAVSADGYGTLVFTTGTDSFRCRVVTEQVSVTNLAGEEEVSNTTVWCKSSSTFGVSDRMTVNGSVLGPLLNVAHFPDEDGHNHSRLRFG